MGILISIVLFFIIAMMFKGGERNGLYGIAGDMGIGAEENYKAEEKRGEELNSTTATAQEKQINSLDLELRQQAQSGLLSIQDLGMKLSEQLLSGGGLPGYLGALPGGISPEVTQNIVDDSLEDVATTAQFGGILDSGTTAELATSAAADIRTESEQFNLNNLMQLLTLAMGGQATTFGMSAGIGESLGTRLADLRNTKMGNKTVTTGRTDGSDIDFAV